MTNIFRCLRMKQFQNRYVGFHEEPFPTVRNHLEQLFPGKFKRSVFHKHGIVGTCMKLTLGGVRYSVQFYYEGPNQIGVYIMPYEVGDGILDDSTLEMFLHKGFKTISMLSRDQKDVITHVWMVIEVKYKYSESGSPNRRRGRRRVCDVIH